MLNEVNKDWNGEMMVRMEVCVIADRIRKSA
jgi:hypothetical protein